MELKAALRRVGASIVQEKVEPESATLYLRVEPDQGERWVDAVSRFLFAVDEQKVTADVSKYFFVSKGEVKYLWRIVLHGGVDKALALLATSSLEAAMAHTPEMTSIPLIGRINYPRDPATGKLKGAHNLDAAPSAISAAFGSAPGGT